MPTKNFDDMSLERINRVLDFVNNNPYSKFYINKYKQQHGSLTSYADFLRIPFLEKTELLERSVDEITFIPREEIAYYSFSSGTTGHNKPAIIPHSLEYKKGEKNQVFDEDKLVKLGVDRILLLQSAMSAGFLKVIKMDLKNALIIPGDITNLKLSARIAKQLGIRGIKTTSTILTSFINNLEEAGFDLKDIKWVSLGGEFCSTQRAEFIKRKLPEAEIIFRYASSEVGFRGYRCPHLENLPPNVFHPAKKAFLEIIDSAGKVLPFGETGEIVHTSLETSATPLIRYKTRDIGSLTPRECACGNNFVLTLGGRADMDMMKINGVVIDAQAIETSLEAVRDYLETFSQMHVYEDRVGNTIKPRLELHLRLKDKFKNDGASPYFKEMIAKKISEHLRLSPRSTLKNLVDQGIFTPLEIVFTDIIAPADTKAKNIISHLS